MPSIGRAAQFTIRIPDAAYRRLCCVAEARGLPIQALVRGAVLDWLAREAPGEDAPPTVTPPALRRSVATDSDWLAGYARAHGWRIDARLARDDMIDAGLLTPDLRGANRIVLAALDGDPTRFTRLGPGVYRLRESESGEIGP